MKIEEGKKYDTRLLAGIAFYEAVQELIEESRKEQEQERANGKQDDKI